MVNSINIASRISGLKNEAESHGDTEMAQMCARSVFCALYDSETTEFVSPEELFGDEGPMCDYVRAICVSLDSNTEEGHIQVGSRRVCAR